MKLKNIFPIILTGIISASVLSSCSDEFLTVDSVGVLSNSVLSNQEGIEKVLLGAYSKLNGYDGPDCLTTVPSQIVPGLLRSEQAHAGFDGSDILMHAVLNDFSATDDIFETGFSATYDAIYKCNQVIQLVDEATDITDEQKNQYIAEARFLRGHFYFILWTGYRNIPWIDETMTDVRQPNFDENGYIDISDKIIADFKYAMDNLAEYYTAEEVGRPNLYAAEAYLAKVLVYVGNYLDLGTDNIVSATIDEKTLTSSTDYYTEAKTLLTELIESGVTSSNESYGLQENYQWNYNPEYENSKESVFAVQCTVNDGTSGLVGTANIAVGFWFTNRSVIQYGNGLGACQPTQWFVDCFRTDENGLPYLDMYATNTESIGSDDGVASTDEYTPDTTTSLDPRLDITVGRRGIPFLDYGLMPGSWLDNAAKYGPYTQKKWAVYKSMREEQISSTSPFSVTSQNMDVIRFDDVLLFAAEVEARVGSLETARGYVNQVRSRIIDNTEYWVLNDDETGYASNYVIGEYLSGQEDDPFADSDTALDAILFERNLEFGLEGYRYFDLVRFGKDVEIMSDYYATESQLRDYLNDNGATYTTATPTLLPIPNTAIINSSVDGDATLKQNPGY